MSDCDGMVIKIQNFAVDEQGNPVQAEIQGISPDSTSTISGLNVNEKIPGDGGTVSGTAKSGSGTNGQASGTIQVALVFNPAVGTEILNLQYSGVPGNKLGWYGCSAKPTANGTANFYVTFATESGKGSACQQTFMLRSYTASEKE